jgi:hypothetical protein
MIGRPYIGQFYEASDPATDALGVASRTLLPTKWTSLRAIPAAPRSATAGLLVGGLAAGCYGGE